MIVEEDIHEFGEIGERARQAVDFVDDDDGDFSRHAARASLTLLGTGENFCLPLLRRLPDGASEARKKAAPFDQRRRRSPMLDVVLKDWVQPTVFYRWQKEFRSRQPSATSSHPDPCRQSGDPTCVQLSYRSSEA
jgi:hypothetical protein